MKRTVFSLLAAFALCVSAAAAGPAVSCLSALLMEKQTGTVLFAQDEHTPREPASVTKIMTLLLVMEAIDSGALSYDDVVTGSAHAAGMGGSDKTIKGEFSANGVENPLSHTRGAISMARSSAMDSASSQFFIVQKDSTFLDGQYACFGYVTDGMDVVDAIAADAQPTDDNGTIPADQQPVIESVKVLD